MSKCNVCWEPLTGTLSVAPCGHCFCDQHAEALLEQCEGCLQCGGPVSNQTLKVVPVDPQEAIVKTALYGLCPENIIKAAHAGFSWWIDQTELTYQEFMRRAADTANGRELRIKAKLQEVHDAYKKAKTKSAQLQEAVTAATNDRDELQKKYEAKSREKRQMEEQLHKLHSENQSLKALRGGVPTAMQPVTAAQQQHDAAMAHGTAQALFSGGFGGNAAPNGGLPVMRSASLHQQHQYSSGMGGGAEAVVTHMRSIHAAVLPQRFDPGSGGGMATPGRGTPAQQRSYGGGGGSGLTNGLSVHAAQPAAPIFAHVAPSPQRLPAMGGSMGAFQGLGGGFRGGGGGGSLMMQPSPRSAPQGMQRGFGM